MTVRYRAPSGDGELLAMPALPDIGAQLEGNAALLRSARAALAGVPLAEFRREAIDEVSVAALAHLVSAGEAAPPPSRRLLATGHQPDFFHPGVWLKNFVLCGLAQQHGYGALNLVVDNDTVKATQVQVPAVSTDPARVSTVQIPFDAAHHELPYEEHHVVDREVFRTFPKRLAEHTRAWGFEPLALRIWPGLLPDVARAETFAESASRVRREVERNWGIINHEIPVSWLSETRAFAGFAQHVLTQLPEFVAAYNKSVVSYRQKNRLRSRNHPVPELQRQGDRIETPFWIWRQDAPTRRRLWARRTDGGFQLDADGTVVGEIAAPPFVRGWQELRAAGWKIRPRALALTLFVRVCLADGFIHGIGGGKYDEVTDDIIRRFFMIEAPGYAVVSATLRLPLPRFLASPAALHETERLVRDLAWNPQRFAETKQQFHNDVDRRAELVSEQAATRSARRARFRNLQLLTDNLRPAVAARRSAALDKLARLRRELAANEILMNREYAWPLFPEDALRKFFTNVLQQLSVRHN